MAVELTSAIEAVEAVAGAAEGISNFVAGPTPTNPALAGVQSAARKGCDNLSASPVRNVLKLGAGTANGMATLCGAYWDQQGYDAPVTEVPFSGGQCPGVSYYVTAQLAFRNLSTGVTTAPALIRSAINQNRNVPGPVQGVFVLQQFPNQSRIQWRGTGNQGDMINASGNSIVFDPTQQEAIISGIAVSPVGDGCGDPDPVTRPGLNPAPDNGEQADFDVDIDNNVLLPDEIISTPFGDFLLSDLVEGILGTLTKSDIDPRLLGNGEPQLDAPQSENGNDGQGGGDEDFGEPPEGRIWIGGVVEVVGGDELYGNIAGSGPENKVYPRVIGNASLKLEGDNSGIIRGTAEQIRSGWTSIFVPSPGLKVTGLRVSVLPQVRYVVYPVSVIDKDSLSNPPEV